MTNRYQYFVARRTPIGVAIEGTPSCKLGSAAPSCGNGDARDVFAEWHWDGQRLVARNDYSGYYPVFYCADSDRVMISESLIRLVALGAPTEYDEEALAAFCRCGFFVQDRTPFRAIRVLPPKAHFVWEDGHLSVQGQIKLTPPKEVSKEAAVDGYIERFRGAMDRLTSTQGTFVVPLTGGRDSRQILLELHRRGLTPAECVTCGESRDIRVASELAERLGLSHRLLPPVDRWIDSTWRKNAVTHLCATEHAWIMVLGDYLIRSHREVYEGSGVGILTRSELLTPELTALYEQKKFDGLARWLFDTVGPGRPFFELLPEPFHFLLRSEQAAIDLTVEELARHAPAANPLTSFNFWNWNRRATALLPLGVERGVARLCMPLMDEDLYDFVSSLTPSQIFQSEPQTQAILKAYPEAAAVPFYDQFQKTPAARRPLFTRGRNWLDRQVLVGRCGSAMWRTLWRMRALRQDASLTARNRAMQDSVMMYLSQLEYCSRRDRAARMLAEVEAPA